jgi:hypothetical protein
MLCNQHRHYSKTTGSQQERKFNMDDRDSTNAVVRAYTPNGGNWNSPAVGGSRQLETPTATKLCTALSKLWDERAAGLEAYEYPDVPDTVFYDLFNELVSLARARGADSGRMMRPLFEEALCCEGPVSMLVGDWDRILEHRVWELGRVWPWCDDRDRKLRALYRAYSVARCGDEDFFEKLLRFMHEKGDLTVAELQSELAVMGISSSQASP